MGRSGPPAPGNSREEQLLGGSGVARRLGVGGQGRGKRTPSRWDGNLEPESRSVPPEVLMNSETPKQLRNERGNVKLS